MIFRLFGSGHMIFLLLLMSFLTGMLWGGRAATVKKWLYSIVCFILYCTVPASIIAGNIGLALIAFGCFVGHKGLINCSATITRKVVGLGLICFAGSTVTIILGMMIHEGELPDIGSQYFYLLILGLFSVMSAIFLLLRPSVVSMMSALVATIGFGFYYILDYDFPSAGVAYLLLLPVMGLNGFIGEDITVITYLKRPFRSLRRTYHPFNRDLARARVAIYHLHKYPGQHVVPDFIIAEYDGGEWAACGVVLRRTDSDPRRYYIYNVLTCEVKEVKDSDTEFSEHQEILKKVVMKTILQG